MKHSVGVILIVAGLFFVAQIIGLVITNAYIDRGASAVQGVLVWKSLPGLAGVPFERPEIDPFLLPVFILGAIGLGSLFVLLLMRIQCVLLWKLWFCSAITMCLYIAFFTVLDAPYAFSVALIVALLKLFRPSLIIHNVTEMFIYGGLAAIFVPLMNLLTVSILLILIAVYDAYAVWKSKHMIALAKFQMKAHMFTGLLVPYKLPPLHKKGVLKKKIRTALLGGGDIAFPLLFAGVVLKTNGLLPSFIIAGAATIALFLLMMFGKQDKFYPAMPFIAAGCFIGYGLTLLL